MINDDPAQRLADSRGLGASLRIASETRHRHWFLRDRMHRNTKLRTRTPARFLPEQRRAA